MSYYQTKYSNLTDFSKRERKQKISTFPYVAPSSNLNNIDLCGQKVKPDIGTSVKFCPLCDHPMIVRILLMPCEHVICFSCSLPESDMCYVCEAKVTNWKRIPDKNKIYECDFADCFKFFEKFDDLYKHKILIHNQQFFLDSKTTANTGMASMGMSSMMGSTMPTTPMMMTLGMGMGMINPDTTMK